MVPGARRSISRCRSMITHAAVGTYYLARGQNYTTYARTANDFEDAWTALVNEYGLQEENAYLHKAQMLIDDEMKPNDSQVMFFNIFLFHVQHQFWIFHSCSQHFPPVFLFVGDRYKP